MESVKDLNVDKQLESIDPDVYTFLSALSSEPYEQKVQILNAYEHISNLSNSYYIGPLNFAMNIISLYYGQQASSGNEVKVQSVRQLHKSSTIYGYGFQNAK